MTLARLDVALKEWAVVCDALASGRQMVLLRKGGIHEAEGEFKVEHDRFLLFPTYLHQNAAMLKPEAAVDMRSLAAEPATVRFSAWAEVVDIFRVGSRRQVDALGAEHVWSPPLIDMRFGYKPHKPLYLLTLRAWRLPAVVETPNEAAYAGCVSWVPLSQGVEVERSTPALRDDEFAERRSKVMEVMSGPT